MKTLACRDLGITCDYIAKGQKDEEVVEAGLEHIKSEHPDYVKDMMETMNENDMRKAAMAKVKTA
jgi:predicted small metal-binding protein